MTRVIGGVVLVLLAASSAGGRTQELLGAPETLRGVESLRVLVENIPEIPSAARTFQTAIELELRRIGVRVHAADDPSARQSPYLYVNVNVLKIRTNHLVYAIDLELRQPVALLRGAGEKDGVTLASTWSRRMVGITPRSDQAAIRKSLMELIKDYVADYEAVKAKK